MILELRRRPACKSTPLRCVRTSARRPRGRAAHRAPRIAAPCQYLEAPQSRIGLSAVFRHRTTTTAQRAQSRVMQRWIPIAVASLLASAKHVAVLHCGSSQHRIADFSLRAASGTDDPAVAAVRVPEPFVIQGLARQAAPGALHALVVHRVPRAGLHRNVRFAARITDSLSGENEAVNQHDPCPRGARRGVRASDGCGRLACADACGADSDFARTNAPAFTTWPLRTAHPPGRDRH